MGVILTCRKPCGQPGNSVRTNKKRSSWISSPWLRPIQTWTIMITTMTPPPPPPHSSIQNAKMPPVMRPLQESREKAGDDSPESSESDSEDDDKPLSSSRSKHRGTGGNSNNSKMNKNTGNNSNSGRKSRPQSKNSYKGMLADSSENSSDGESTTLTLAKKKRDERKQRIAT